MRYGLFALFATCLLATPASADRDEDENGKGRRGDRGQHEYNFDRGSDRGRGDDRERGYYQGRSYDRDRGYAWGRGSYNMDRDYKQEYRRGNCKIERKWERGGGYEEEVKCKGRYRD